MEKEVEIGSVWREHRGFDEPSTIRTLEKLRPRELSEEERASLRRSCLDDRYIPTVVRSPDGKR
jgi:hypothetical protein